MSRALVPPLGRSDVEPAQLARQSRLGAAVSVEPGRVMVLHVRHLLVVHGAAPSPVGHHRPPALGRPVVLEEKKKQKKPREI